MSVLRAVLLVWAATAAFGLVGMAAVAGSAVVSGSVGLPMPPGWAIGAALLVVGVAFAVLYERGAGWRP